MTQKMSIQQAVELFPYTYVAGHPQINEGDLLLVTPDNIKFLRKVLSTTNFKWCSGHLITECVSFRPYIVIKISKNNTTYYDLYDEFSKTAINYRYASL